MSNTTRNLTVEHRTLDAAHPARVLEMAERETLIYSLTGRIRVYANGGFLGTIGGRSAVTDPLAHVLRFPAGVPFLVHLVLDGFAADYLLVSCEAAGNTMTRLPYMHWNDTHWHLVGTGTSQRTVGEVPTPPLFQISCGETLNIPGGISSWPPHANEDDLRRFAAGQSTWEEVFFVVCPAPARASLDGLYAPTNPVKQTITLYNGDIVAMPLGAHPVTAAAGQWCWYAWFYCGDALQKEYRRQCTDVQVYRK